MMTLSFKVLELRALKSVARVVWSIIHGVESIATFLCIYILGVLGFLTAFLHMMPACPDAASCQNPSSFVGSTLPSDFLGALSGMQLVLGHKPFEQEEREREGGGCIHLNIFFCHTVC
jgi:hypothetical protein